jgi:hypothetical protein
MPTGKYLKTGVCHNPDVCNKTRQLAIQNTNTVIPKIRLLCGFSLLASNKTLVTRPCVMPIMIKISNIVNDVGTIEPSLCVNPNEKLQIALTLLHCDADLVKFNLQFSIPCLHKQETPEQPAAYPI